MPDSVAHVASIVPEANDRLSQVVLIPQSTQCRGAQEEIPPGSRIDPKPPGRQHAQDVPARKYQDIPTDRPQPAYHAIGTGTDLVRRFSAGTAVAEELPVRPFLVNVGRATSFVVAVVPFHEVRVYFRHAAEAGELACSGRTLQGTRIHS